MRQLAIAAIGLAIRNNVYGEETALLSLNDRNNIAANNWNPMRVVSNEMANNRDLVTAILRDF